MMPSATAERPDGRKPLDVLHLAIALRRYAPHHTASASPAGGVRYAVRSGNGDPACWRPAWGAGFAVRQCLVVAFAPTPGVPLRSG